MPAETISPPNRVARATAWLALLKATLRSMIGLPDYQVYVAHRQQHHPDQPILSEAEFIRERQEARYGNRQGKMIRCC
ncbi:MAG: YbdD/YjiX family protein [Magnetococcales bacterium]|nr:YbdD/YjiX family protein [Magnetococcales bacterium]